MNRILYTSPYVPAEYIAAHGFQPSRILPDPGGAQSATGNVKGLCPYARSFADEIRADRSACAVIVTTTCDQMRRIAELIARNSAVSVFLMNVPATWQTSAAQELYLSELDRLGRFLVRLGAKPPSPEHLAQTMRRYDGLRAAVRKARDRFSARLYAQAIAEFNRTGEPVPERPGTDRRRKGIPLAILGGPLPRTEYGLLDEIEKAGGRVALDGAESGERATPAAFDKKRLLHNPLQELARAYFGTIPDAFQRPNDPLYSWLDRSLARRRVRGIIIRHYMWCDIWRAEVRRIAERTNLPVLHIDTEGDLSRERTAERIRAFLEILK